MNKCEHSTSNEHKIAVKLIFNDLLDMKYHDLYDFHVKYRFSIGTIYNAVTFLLDNDLIIKRKESIMIAEQIDNQKLSIINRLSKTSKPSVLIDTMLDI
ncbi:hypothetical protein L4D76_10270 [Photobacterium sagamiensis]|uniref:hypothetical protein n=1 Tax=Photobacterium sagamiensis TaxID=2910241 RepID=UPI003D1157D4